MTNNIQLNALIEQRRALAPEALAGDAAALAEYNALSEQIATEERKTQLAADAQLEQRRRRDEEEQRQREAERREKEAALDGARAELNKQLAALEGKIKALVGPVEAAIEQGERVYQLSRDLNFHVRWNLKDRIAIAVRQALAPALHPALEGVQREYRRMSLVEDARPSRLPEFKPCKKGCGSMVPDIPNHTHNCDRVGPGLTTSERFVGMSADGNHAKVIDVAELVAKTGETDAERKARHAKIDQLFDDTEAA
jgi:hypothetical protein